MGRIGGRHRETVDAHLAMASDRLPHTLIAYVHLTHER